MKAERGTIDLWQKSAARFLCPGGTVEHSPAIYRWVHSPAIDRWGQGAQQRLSPGGTVEINAPHSFNRPFGTRQQNHRSSPAINRRATVNRPDGTFA
jgi:hypothetical protein